MAGAIDLAETPSAAAVVEDCLVVQHRDGTLDSIYGLDERPAAEARVQQLGGIEWDWIITHATTDELDDLLPGGSA
jgi:hypothetical protein